MSVEWVDISRAMLRAFCFRDFYLHLGCLLVCHLCFLFFPSLLCWGRAAGRLSDTAPSWPEDILRPKAGQPHVVRSVAITQDILFKFYVFCYSHIFSHILTYSHIFLHILAYSSILVQQRNSSYAICSRSAKRGMRRLCHQVSTVKKNTVLPCKRQRQVSKPKKTSTHCCSAVACARYEAKQNLRLIKI